MPGIALDQAFVDLLVDSHQRIVGTPLGGDVGVLSAEWLYAEAPFCLLAHEPTPDPRFIYANRAAQACFGYGWDEFLTLPSRLSAAPVDRAERQHLLDTVAAQGFIRNYRGERVAKSGRRFWIAQATVWTLADRAGVEHGQAAVFAKPDE